MSAILGQLSVAIGFILMVIVLIITTAQGVPITVAVFRGIVVMCVSSVVMALFFRFFISVLYRFLAEKVMEHRASRNNKSRSTISSGSTRSVEGAE